MFYFFKRTQKDYLQMFIRRIWNALKWYERKNPKFTKQDAALLLSHYGDILKNQSEDGK